MLKKAVLILLGCSALSLWSAPARAHCDTLGGPVIADARTALQSGDVTPVLKWIKPQDESEVRAAFQKALVVRALGADARSVADQFFFETLVRLHRAGEGAPFTGLKDQMVEPHLAAADKALAAGSGEDLVKALAAEVSAELRQRLAAAAEARRHAADSVSAGREYVARYVELMHYIERLQGGSPEQMQAAHQH